MTDHLKKKLTDVQMDGLVLEQSPLLLGCSNIQQFCNQELHERIAPIIENLHVFHQELLAFVS